MQRIGAAHIDGNRQTPLLVLLLELDERNQQLWRQVVHAVIARVLQGVKRHRFARAGHASDEDDVHAQLCAALRPVVFKGAVPSISRAWARVVADNFSPPSMRAISITRSSPFTART